MKKIFVILFLYFCMSYCAFASIQLQINVMPGTALPISIFKGQSATAYYLVENRTQGFQKGNYVRYLPPNVIQVTESRDSVFGDNLCNKYFDLAPYQSCILQLNIAGEVKVDDPDPAHHLLICQSESDCTKITDKKNELNLIIGNNNPLMRVAILHLQNADSSYRPVAYTSTDNGISWKSQMTVGGGFIKDISCRNQHCVAIGNIFSNDGHQDLIGFLTYTSSDGGVTWQSAEIEKHRVTSSVNAVSCTGQNGDFCAAVGTYSSVPEHSLPASIIYTSTNGGNNWKAYIPEKRPAASLSALKSVSCTGEKGQYCTAVGTSVSQEGRRDVITFISYTTRDGGVSWSSSIIGKHQSVADIEAINCSGDKGQHCVVLGSSGQNNMPVNKPIIYTSFDGGISWKSFIPEEYGVLNSVSCNGDNGINCIAVGKINRSPTDIFYVGPAIYRSTNGGVDWTFYLPLRYAAGAWLEAVTCSGDNDQFCTAIGGDNTFGGPRNVVFTSIDGGKSWEKEAGFSLDLAVKKQITSIMSLSGGV
ncbi:MAG: WD40/YVTN/BNR-like repeat-containing protein [Gammaproteobacteria bacterium]